MKHSWGNYPAIDSKSRDLWWIDDVVNHGPILPVGLGRSYGDSATLSASEGELLCVRRCNRFLGYDAETRVLHAEAGCSVEDILTWAVPRGLFLPVVPGTRHVTLGGALANDIHGKNHHAVGTFGRAVKEFHLIRSDRGRVKCQPNEELFEATIGGLGLTGIITDLKVELHEISGAGMIEEETRHFSNINEACEQLLAMDQEYPMTVAWIDMGSSRSGSGVSMGGCFVEGEMQPLRPSKVTVPFHTPSCLLNRLSIGAFNRIYKMTRKAGKTKVPYGSYFFPLDGVGNWNRLYGKRGFLQYQVVIPLSAQDILEKMRLKIEASDERAFLSVLKKFGKIVSPGWLSFPQSGWTLAMDFPMKGESTLKLLSKLDEIVSECGGRIYPAKDARMEASFFKASYPKWAELEKLRDPQIISEFWRRVAL